MEDRRTAIAILLCMFVFMFWFEVVMAPYKNQPAPAAPQPGAPATVPSGAQPAAQPFVPPAAGVPAQPRPASHPNPAEVQDSGETTIDLGNTEVSISHLGGRMLSYKLKNYKAQKGGESALDLVANTENTPFPLAVYAGMLNDDYVKYTAQAVNPSSASFLDGKYYVNANSRFELLLKGSLPDETEIEKIFTFTPGSYLFNLEVKLNRRTADGSKIWVEWNHFDPQHAGSGYLNHNYLAILDNNNKVQLRQLSEIEPSISDFGLSRWTSFGDKYFMTTIVAEPSAADTRIGKEGNTFFYRLSGTDTGASFKIYAGPKYHSELAKTGFQLERNVDLGWFAFIAHPLLALLNLFYRLLGNYGLAIVLLTLVIKALFFPLTRKSFESMRAMQELQPEMKALRERIKDPTQLNKERMGLYKKHNVNPMGGCLPVLIQLPVFLGLYNALNYSIELRHAPFALWIQDLSSPERLEVLGIGIPVMVLLMGASMFVQQVTTPSAADPQQKRIMLMMPVIFTISFVIFPFPSGLTLYWLVNNLISITQQVYLRSDKQSGALKGTVLASVVIFGFAYLLTLL